MWHHLTAACGTFFPVQSSGNKPIHHVCPSGELLSGAGFVGEDKSSPVMPCCVTFVLNVLSRGVYTGTHIDGFHGHHTLSDVIMAKLPEYISQLRGPAAQSDTTGQI